MEYEDLNKEGCSNVERLRKSNVIEEPTCNNDIEDLGNKNPCRPRSLC